MKRQAKKVNLLLKAALRITKLNVNSTCSFHIYQSQLPTGSKKLRNSN